MSEQEIYQGLGLTNIKSRQWSMYKISAKNGTGLQEAFEWYHLNLTILGWSILSKVEWGKLE